MILPQTIPGCLGIYKDYFPRLPPSPSAFQGFKLTSYESLTFSRDASKSSELFMAGTTDGRPFATLGPKGGRQVQKLTKYLHFADLDWVIDTLLLKVFRKSRLTLLQVLLDSWSSCRGDPPKQYQSQLKPLAQWLAVVSWADTACSCWGYFLIFCEFSAIFCRWTNSNLHSVAKHKHVRVCLRVSVSCALGAILHKYFI